MTLSRPISGTRRTLTVGALALALAAAGCGGSSHSSASGASSTAKGPDPNAPEVSPAGDIPDNQAFVAYSPPGSGYSVKVPEGWSRATSARGTTFTDKLNSITMRSRAASAPMTVQEARRAEVPKLAREANAFHLGTITTVQRKAGTAIRITYTTTGRPDPVTGKSITDAVERYIFSHRGKDLLLTLSGPKGADNVDPWRIVTDSVRWSA
jgi:hypothetical protein